MDKTDFRWKNIGKEHWRKCDLKQTEWGKARQKMPGGNVILSEGGGVMFELRGLKDVETIRTQCEEQAMGSCGK